MSQETFIAGMQSTLGRSVRVRQGQPDRGDLLEYFQAIGDLHLAVEQYTEYARSFYVHTMFVPGDRDGDVSWPGGSCDRWSEINSRPRHQSRRIIDCEGYAYLAGQLLGAAGWRVRGYQVIFRPATQTSPLDSHLVAVLEHPEDSANRLFIGTTRPSPSAVTEANRLWPGSTFDVQYGSIEPDARRAIRAATEYVEDESPREVAPMRLRRSVAPPPL
jgi:hypothetical protein